MDSRIKFKEVKRFLSEIRKDYKLSNNDIKKKKKESYLKNYKINF